MEYFNQVSILGLPLIFVVIGLVEYIKKLGVDGKSLLAASMAIGLVLGIGYQISVNGLPVNFGGWFSITVYGLGLGIVASGIYDAVKNIISK